MAHRTILTERQRAALFDLPTDETLMLRHYTLADEDIEHINERRRPENKIVLPYSSVPYAILGGCCHLAKSSRKRSCASSQPSWV
jgi:hypothetical protein